MKNYISFIFLFFSVFCLYSQSTLVGTGSAENIRRHIGYLASDSLKGRFPGTKGNDLAAKYILEKFKSFGLVPLAEKGYQYFDLVTRVSGGPGNKFSFGNFNGKAGEDFNPFSFSENKTLEAMVVFAGYGFDISGEINWSDYKGLDVKGKWVIVLRGNPENNNPKSKFVDYDQERAKTLTAKDKGAAGVIFVTGSEIEKNDEVLPVYFDKTISSSGLPVINIKRTVADKILSYSNDKSLSAIDSLEKRMIRTKMPISFEIPLKVKAKTDVVLQKARVPNVIAILKGSDTSSAKPYIVIGAHFDHLGMGGPGSGSMEPEKNAVHNGADDNASGVAALIETARLLSLNKKDLKRNIVFISFNAEELGTIGSKFFVKSNLIDPKKVDAMFNFDMVGRLRDDTKQLTVSGSGTSLEADSILRLYGKDRKFVLNLFPDGFGSSDQSSFYSEDIPVFFFTTGAHEDYHTPQDKVEKINFEGEKDVVNYAVDLIKDISKTKDLNFRESGPKQESRGTRYKVTLGIIPDMAASGVKGLRVDGLRKGGPAEKGGILKGDVIIAINKQPVGNIYDYMSRLASLKAGQTASVEVLRDGKKEVLLVVL